MRRTLEVVSLSLDRIVSGRKFTARPENYTTRDFAPTFPIQFYYRILCSREYDRFAYTLRHCIVLVAQCPINMAYTIRIKVDLIAIVSTPVKL